MQHKRNRLNMFNSSRTCSKPPSRNICLLFICTCGAFGALKSDVIAKEYCIVRAVGLRS